MGSLRTRDQTLLSCVGRQILNTGPPGKSSGTILTELKQKLTSSRDGYGGCWDCVSPF